MLARLFVFVGSLIVLALLAALIGPYFIDWTTYRSDFERNASIILGREVKVNGAAKARILPFPSVTFTDVTVRDTSGDGLAMTIDEFSMDLELAPFLSGDVLIFDMRLVRPKASINIDGEGRVDWVLRPNAPFDPRNITLEHVAITDGEVRIRSGNGIERKLTEVNATVAARTLAGPWRADGSLRFDGRKALVSGSTGVADAEGLRLKLKVEPADLPVIAELEGLASASESGVLTYKGAFRATERLAAAKGNRLGAVAQAQPVGNRASGRFELSDKRLQIDEFRFEAGPVDDPYVANGTASVDFGVEPHFSVSATGAQIRIDDDGEQQSASGATVADRLALIESVLGGLPLPTMPGAVDIKLPAIVAGDTTVRDVAFTATTAQLGWNIDRLTASLPGRTTLEANGVFSVRPALGFTGKMLVAVGQPSGFASWLANDIDAPVRRLSKAGVDARVELSAGRQKLDDLELILGDARFKGSFERVQDKGGKPHMAVELDGGATSADEAIALASFFLDATGRNRFSDHDLDIKLKAAPLGDAPRRADSVDLAMRLSGQTVEIDKLSVSGLAGASIAATGHLEQLGAMPKAAFDASIIGEDLAPLADLFANDQNRFASWLSRSAQDYTGLLKDARIDVVANAAAREAGEGEIRLTAKGSAGGTAIDASFSASGAWAQPDSAVIDLKAKLAAADGSALLALGGAPVLPLGMIGAAQADIALNGIAATGLQSTINIKWDDATGSFSGMLATPADGLRIRGAAKLDAPDIEPWLMTSGLALPGMGAGMEARLKADVDYGKGLLVLGNMSGALADHAVSGDLNVEVRDGRPNITGTLVADEIDLGQAAQMVLGPSAFEPGDGVWPTAPFQSDMNAPLRADLDISAASLVFGSDVAAQEAVLSLQLDDEGLKVPELSARFNDSTLTGLFDLKNSAATGLFTGQFRLAGSRLENVLPKLGVDASSLSGTMDIAATLTASGKSVSAMMASLAGSGSATLSGISIKGLDPTAFAQLVKAADAIGRDVDAARTSKFAPDIVRKGLFEAGSADVAFTVVGGVVRIPPVRFERADSILAGELKVDLNRLDVEAKGTLGYNPGEDALVGSEPTVNLVMAGPLDAPALTLDTQPLGQFLTQRALEIEQARVEAMQAALLEKQRLRREANYYAALDLERKRAAEEQRRLEEEARRKAEEDARLKAEEEARRLVEEEAARKAQEEAQHKAEEEARKRAAEEARIRAMQPAVKTPQPQPTTQPPVPTPPTEAEMPAIAPAPQARPQQPAQPQPSRAPQSAPRPVPPKPAEFPPAPKPSAITDFLRSLQGIGGGG